MDAKQIRDELDCLRETLRQRERWGEDAPSEDEVMHAIGRAVIAIGTQVAELVERADRQDDLTLERAR